MPFSMLTPPAVLSRDANHQDVFAVGLDGRIWTTYWAAGDAGWHAWFPITDRPDDPSRAVFSQKTPPVVLSRDANHQDVFAVGLDGRIWTTYWAAGETGWHAWFPITDQPGNPDRAVFAQENPPVVLSRDANHQDVFAVGLDGRIWTTYWTAGDAGWHAWFPITDRPDDPTRAVFSQKTPPVVLSRDANHQDVFAVGLDGRIWTTYWAAGETGWHAWFPITDQPDNSSRAVFSAETPPVVLSRDANHQDVFAVGLDGRIWTTYWAAGDTGWHTWFPLSENSSTFRGQISSGGLAALGGWAEVTISADGGTRWRGHAHDSGADGYDFGLSALLSSGDGRVIAFAHAGHVGGTVTGGARDHDWDELHPARSDLSAHYRSFELGQFQLRTEYSSDIGSTIEGALSILTGWVLGSTPLGSAIGLVVFVGVEVGSLISTGSLVPGARVIGGVLWLAGPSNTLLALAAEGIASAGSRSRELTDDEYRFADEEVFRGTLPPKDRLVLTDTIGAGDRAFTFPRFDGKITLNMGPDSYDDPRLHHVRSGQAVFGQIFIHEMVHAWQIAHTPFDLALLADALASKICEASGTDPYVYEAAGAAYSSFNLEQQAQIVSDWFRDGKSEDSPYFRYVQNNIRTGQY